MKNLRVSAKLSIAFLIVIALSVVIGVMGIIGMNQINNASDRMYRTYSQPLTYISYAKENLQEIRFLIREYMVVTSVVDDQARVAVVRDRLEHLVADTNRVLDAYAPTAAYLGAQAEFNRARQGLNDEYFPFVRRTHDMAVAGDSLGIFNELGVAIGAFNFALGTFGELFDLQLDSSANAVASNAALFRTLFLVIVIALVVAVVLSVALAVYISGIISKPLVPLTSFFHRAAAEGDLSFTPDERGALNKFRNNKDELGTLSHAVDEFINELTHEMEMLEQVADGDLTITPNILSDKDVVGKSLTKVVDNLNNMFAEINIASAQVSTGSSQIADGAQMLAQGSTEQAATVEELSATISEIAGQTNANAEMASKAAELAVTIKDSAEKGNKQMDEMVGAVNEISEASKSIGKVIKVIDDIAFQTNILALNAAVEAARAGQHGKGFAVVADEVRTLAAKSAEAAKDTGSLISNSIEKAEYGAQIATETAESLVEIVSGINESSQIINDIAMASESQTSGIKQINTGIDQVAQVVHQNSATAQESAAASEQLSGQSAMLENLIARFRLKGDDDTLKIRSVYKPNISLNDNVKPKPKADVPTATHGNANVFTPDRATFSFDTGDMGKY